MKSFEESLSIKFRAATGFLHIFCAYNENHSVKNWYQVIIIKAGCGTAEEAYDLNSKKEMIEKFMELVRERL